MTAEDRLEILKSNLQMLTDANDGYLRNLLLQAEAAIEREGIVLEDSVECDMAVIQYAAYLFRKRGAADMQMPRFLRYQLNNILFSQKGKKHDV